MAIAAALDRYGHPEGNNWEGCYICYMGVIQFMGVIWVVIWVLYGNAEQMFGKHQYHQYRNVQDSCRYSNVECLVWG